MIKKVGNNPICNHSEDEECTFSCTSSSVVDVIASEELDSFYNTLDANSFYELQADISCDGYTKRHKGFISTYPDGENLGIFTRGFSLDTSGGTLTANTFVSPLNNNEIQLMSVTSSDFNFANAYEYRYYQNEFVGNLTYSDQYIIKWTAQDSGTYVIETIGNIDTVIYEFTTSNGVINSTPRYRRDGGVGDNPSWTVIANAGVVRYFVLELEGTTSGPCAFRIKRTDMIAEDPDGISGYRDEVQAAYTAGTFSNDSYSDCYVNYDGDVNIFVYDVKAGKGTIRFIEPDKALKAIVYAKQSTMNGSFDRVWQDTQFVVTPAIEDNATTAINELNPYYEHIFAKGIYYIDVMEANLPDVGTDDYYAYNVYHYGFEFFDPEKKDHLDMIQINNNPNNAYNITTLNFEDENLTLHSGDSDWFKFTTDANGGKVNVKMYQHELANQHTICMYDNVTFGSVENSWSVSDYVAWGRLDYDEMVDEDGNEYEVHYRKFSYDLEPNHTYYILVEPVNANNYSSMRKYKLCLNIENKSAVLSNNVNLSHTVDNDITDISAFKNTVMESLTCYNSGEAVTDATALVNVKLYSGDTELTAEVVNGLTAGQYPITVKYYDSVATGGIVTLSVTEQATNTEFSIYDDAFPMVVAEENFLDWLASAKLIANVRLGNEGESLSTIDLWDALDELADGAEARGDLAATLNAANYFYGATSSFRSSTAVTDIETTLYNALLVGKPVIMQLTSTTDPTNMNLARYIVLVGIDTTNDKYQIIDTFYNPNNPQWVEQSVINNGGYRGDNTLVFSGRIISKG